MLYIHVLYITRLSKHPDSSQRDWMVEGLALSLFDACMQYAHTATLSFLHSVSTFHDLSSNTLPYLGAWGKMLGVAQNTQHASAPNKTTHHAYLT